MWTRRRDGKDLVDLVAHHDQVTELSSPLLTDFLDWGVRLVALANEINAQQRALGDLQRARAATSDWLDEQRQRLDAQRLSALEAAARDVLRAFTEVSQLAASADRLLSR